MSIPAPKVFQVTFIHTIPENRIVELLICAWENGSYYWARANGNPWVEQQLNLPVRVKDVEEGSSLPLDYKHITRGLQIMAEKYTHHFQNFIDQNEDAETGDVFLQCCLFGEVIYG